MACPSREGLAGSGFARARGCALQDRIDQVADGVDSAQLRFFDVAAEFFFKLAEHFDALHRIESEIEFQVERGPHAWEVRSAKCL